MWIFSFFILFAAAQAKAATFQADAATLTKAGYTYSEAAGAWIDGDGRPADQAFLLSLYKDKIAQQALEQMKSEPALVNVSLDDRAHAIQTRLQAGDVEIAVSAPQANLVDVDVHETHSSANQSTVREQPPLDLAKQRVGELSQGVLMSAEFNPASDAAALVFVKGTSSSSHSSVSHSSVSHSSVSHSSAPSARIGSGRSPTSGSASLSRSRAMSATANRMRTTASLRARSLAAKNQNRLAQAQSLQAGKKSMAGAERLRAESGKVPFPASRSQAGSSSRSHNSSIFDYFFSPLYWWMPGNVWHPQPYRSAQAAAPTSSQAWMCCHDDDQKDCHGPMTGIKTDDTHLMVQGQRFECSGGLKETDW